MEHMNDPKLISHLTSCTQPAVEGLRLGQAERISKSLAGSVCVCVASCVGTSFTAICCYLAIRERKVDSKCFAALRDIQGACFVPGSSPMCHANMTI